MSRVKEDFSPFFDLVLSNLVSDKELGQIISILGRDFTNKISEIAYNLCVIVTTPLPVSDQRYLSRYRFEIAEIVKRKTKYEYRRKYLANNPKLVRRLVHLYYSLWLKK